MSKELSKKTGYTQWFGEIKKLVLSSQQRAALKVNQELLQSYWFIGDFSY